MLMLSSNPRGGGLFIVRGRLRLFFLFFGGAESDGASKQRYQHLIVSAQELPPRRAAEKQNERYSRGASGYKQATPPGFGVAGGRLGLVPLKTARNHIHFDPES